MQTPLFVRVAERQIINLSQVLEAEWINGDLALVMSAPAFASVPRHNKRAPELVGPHLVVLEGDAANLVWSRLCEVTK